MKKISVRLVIAALLFTTISQAQSLKDGINDYYATRYASAKSIFEKLVAANPNNIEANFWLGQNFLAEKNITAAKSVYEKALLSSANAPLLLVGMGQVELLENKVNEARQRFETAVTMSKGKKGNDPEILNAVGRSITNAYTIKEKKGDINYAVQVLQEASAEKIKDKRLLSEIFVNLGNAYRKAKPGEGGSQAFEAYQKATEADPSFAVAPYRSAQLFNSQRQWDMYEKYLTEAVEKDNRFAPAYYDLYYLKLGKLDFATAEDYAKKYISSSDPGPESDYLRVQTLFAKKDYDQAIAGAKNIIAQVGSTALARNYKLIAYSLLAKKDSAGAKSYVDDYFKKADPEELIAKDFEMKADAYSAIPGMEDQVQAAYIQGAATDTVLENKIETLRRGAKFFQDKNMRDREATLIKEMIAINPKASMRDYYDVMRAYYFAKNYDSSYTSAIDFSNRYPEEIYGWEFRHYSSSVLDTVAFDSIAIPDAVKLLEVSKKDSVKFNAQRKRAANFLAMTYVNKLKDAVKGIEYLKEWQLADPANKDAIQEMINSIEPVAKQQLQQKAANNTKEKSSQPGSGG